MPPCTSSTLETKYVPMSRVSVKKRLREQELLLPKVKKRKKTWMVMGKRRDRDSQTLKYTVHVVRIALPSWHTRVSWSAKACRMKIAPARTTCSHWNKTDKITKTEGGATAKRTLCYV